MPTGHRHATRAWRRLRAVAAAASIGAIVAASSEALAEPTTSIPVVLEPSSAVMRIEGESINATCRGRCVMQVPPGHYKVTSASLSLETTVAGPTAFAHRPGPRKLHIGAGVAAIATGALALTAIVVPIFVCSARPRRNTAVQPVPDGNPCQNASTGLRNAWIVAGATAFTLTIFSGVVWFATGPSITARDLEDAPEHPPARSEEARLRLHLAPFASLAEAGPGDVRGGLAIAGSF